MNKNNTLKDILYKPTSIKNRSTQLEYLYSFDDILQSRVCNCGKYVVVSKYQNKETSKLSKVVEQSSMCETKFCPVCNYYRALRYSHSVACTMREYEQLGYDFLFMTLTVPNCQHEDLDYTLKKMSYAFNSGLMKTKEFKQFKGYIRTTELTFKRDDNQAHPHYHSIIICDKNYKKKSNPLYINNTVGYFELSKLWHRYYMSCFEILDKKTGKKKFSFDFTETPDTETGLICSLMPIRSKQYRKDGKLHYKDRIESAVNELSKYITKSNDLKNVTPEQMYVIHNQLKGKRFISTSSNIKLNKYKVEKAKDNEILELIERIMYMFSRQEQKYIYQKMIDNEVNIPDLQENKEFDMTYIRNCVDKIKNLIRDSRYDD